MKGRLTLFLLYSTLFFGCKKFVEAPEETCFVPYVDFVTHHIDPSSFEVSFNPEIRANGNIQSHLWEFGDGTSYTGPFPPPHQYPPLPAGVTSKKYTVRYTVANECGKAYWSHDITLGACLPDAKFSYKMLNDSTVQFTNESTKDSTVIYLWTFGDGTTGSSAEASFTKVYHESKTFTVSLKATNACGDNFFSASIAINLPAPAPTPTPTPTPTPCVKPEAAQAITRSGCSDVNLNAGASKNAAKYRWNFGNGTVLPATPGTASTITYTYPSPGSYTITLTVFNAEGCDSAKATTTVVIDEGKPVANTQFSYQPEDLGFTFSREAVQKATSYSWDFGDGTSSNQQNPGLKTYPAPGNYTLTLSAFNACGSTSFSTGITVPFYRRVPNLPATGFQDMIAVSAAAVYYLGTNGKLYRADTTGYWTTPINLPATLGFTAETRLYRDLNNNIWIYGKGEIAKFNPSSSSWTSYFKASGFANNSTITGMTVDAAGNVWSTDEKQVRKNGTVVSSDNKSRYSSLAYAPASGRIWITSSNRETIYYGTANGNQLTSINVSAISGGAEEVKVHPNGDIYLTTANGLLRTNSTGTLTGQFTSANTNGLVSVAPTRYAFDDKGNVWMIVGGKLIKMSVSSAGTARNYSFTADLQALSAVDVLRFSTTDNDIIITKTTGNATAIKIR